MVKKSSGAVFLKIYNEMEKDNDKFVSKNELVSNVMKELKQSQMQVYRKFKIVEKHFETKKIGRAVFVRLKGEKK